ncbi:MAG: PAS domain S-box protein [Pseudomonadota bacterium]|nr:PAS domain S-box protein [Pseudomonadota bacterium]
MHRPKIQDLWTSRVLETLFDSSGIGFCIVAPNRYFLDANQGFCERLGYTREELLGMTIVDITHPDDLHMTHQVFDRGVVNDRTQVFDKRYRTKSGATVWMRLRSTAVRNAEGRIIHRIVMAEDITDEKENEVFLEQMAAIVEASEDAIFRATPSGVIQFWSKGAERLYGWKAEEVIGKRLGFIAADERMPKVTNVPERLLRGEIVHDPDGQGRHKDGHILNVFVQIFPLKDRDGTVIAFAAMHRDISELKSLEEQLRHSQRMETAGLLAGGIAHDFNNILTVIQGSCSALAPKLPPQSSSAPYLDLVERAAEKASRLTRQLLAFSRKQKIAPEVLDPAALLRESATLLRRTLGDAELHMNPESTWTVCEDPTQFEQIVLNLCVNARHAMKQGGRVTITTRDVADPSKELHTPDAYVQHVAAAPGPGPHVLLEVADTGHGINEDLLPHIFEPFFTTKASGEGTGLGLAVVYGAVTQSGGGIVVLTSRYDGSIFRILLPRASGKAKRTELPVAVPQQVHGRARILVLEDDQDVRALIVGMLRSGGYTVYEAASPRPLLERGLEAEVDLILSDVVMPDMSGPEFARYWLERDPRARFLFMSGYFDDNKYADQLTAGNLLLKPFKPAELLQRVAQKLASDGAEGAA